MGALKVLENVAKWVTMEVYSPKWYKKKQRKYTSIWMDSMRVNKRKKNILLNFWMNHANLNAILCCSNILLSLMTVISKLIDRGSLKHSNSKCIREFKIEYKIKKIKLKGLMKKYQKWILNSILIIKPRLRKIR